MKFRKKPVVIDAFQMTEARRMDNSDWPNWLNSAWNEERDQEGSLQRADMTAVLPDMLEIVTREGNHKVSWGDYIIRGVQGELYPCKPEIFVATYEPVGYIDPAEVLEAASMWKGPGETPHPYYPDYMAQGDCQICGHPREAHQSAPDAVARLVEAAQTVMWRARHSETEEWQHFNRRPSWREVQPLYAHPPQPSASVVEALRELVAACEAYPVNIPRADAALDNAHAALRALKGSDQ